jgi:hypothetical protein
MLRAVDFCVKPILWFKLEPNFGNGALNQVFLLADAVANYFYFCINAFWQNYQLESAKSPNRFAN